MQPGRPPKKVTRNRRGSQKKVVRDVKQTLVELMRQRNPEKSKLFSELKYTELRKRGVGIPFLRRVGFDIPMMMHIGVPAAEIVQAVPLKRVVEILRNPNIGTTIEGQLLKALRKKGVSAKTLYKLHIQPGTLHAHGGYTRKEMVEGGISEKTVDFIIDNLKRSRARFKK